MSTRTIVMKFGSSVIPSESALRGVVEEIRRRRDGGWSIVAVVSAIGGATDGLLTHARRFGSENESALAAYVSTGELQAAALLALALGRSGIDSVLLDAAAAGLRTTGPVLDAEPSCLDVERVRRALEGAPVVVVPGFIGRDAQGGTTLLGRGGSDLTALFIASRLGARCRLVKDVDGLYDRDPAGREGSTARRFERVSYDDVLMLDEGIVQHKAVRLARTLGLEFEVGPMGPAPGTTVGAGETILSPEIGGAGAGGAGAERGFELVVRSR